MSRKILASRPASQKQYFKTGLGGFAGSVIFAMMTAVTMAHNPDDQFTGVVLVLVTSIMAYGGAYSLWKWHKLAFPIEHAESD